MWTDTDVNGCEASFKANIKAVEQTVAAEMNLGNKSKTKPNPFILLAVEKCINSLSKYIEIQLCVFFCSRWKKGWWMKFTTLCCVDKFVKLHCKMDPWNELGNETKPMSWTFLEIVSA